MIDLIGSDWINLVFAIVGAILGWYYKKSQDAPTTPELGPILDTLNRLLAQRKQEEATKLLQTLAEETKKE